MPSRNHFQRNPTRRTHTAVLRNFTLGASANRRRAKAETKIARMMSHDLEKFCGWTVAGGDPCLGENGRLEIQEMIEGR